MASIRKRLLKNGEVSWQLTIPLPKTADGKRPLYQRQFKTQTLAKAHMKEKEAGLDKGMDIRASGALTVGDLFDRFLAEKVVDYAARRRTNPGAGLSTMVNYKHAFAYARPAMGHIKLDKLTNSLPLDELKHELLVTKGLSVGTVRLYLLLVFAAIKWGANKKLIARDVSKDTRLPPLDPDAEEFVLPEHTEMLMAITRFGMVKPGRTVRRRDGELYEVLARTLAKTGLRLGEALALRWEHIDEGALTLRVVKGKTAKARRTISIDQGDLEVLNRLRDLEWVGNGYVFVRDNGKQPSRRSLETRMQRVGEALGFRLYPHLLRHYHASLCIEIGMDFKSLQERLGHESITTTMNTYGHLRRDHDRDAMTRAAALLRDAGW